MESVNSIIGFFFNLVPGVLFIFSLKHFGVLKISDFTTEVAFFYLIFGLFIGFFLQGITKVVRTVFFDELVFEWIGERSHKNYFDTAVKILLRKKLIQENNKGNRKDIFYLMDNYLRGENKALMLSNFTARLAFWSNIFFAIVALGLILDFKNVDPKEWNQPLMLLFLFSGWLSWEHLRILYSSVLQTFITTMELKD